MVTPTEGYSGLEDWVNSVLYKIQGWKDHDSITECGDCWISKMLRTHPDWSSLIYLRKIENTYQVVRIRGPLFLWVLLNCLWPSLGFLLGPELCFSVYPSERCMLTHGHPQGSSHCGVCFPLDSFDSLVLHRSWCSDPFCSKLEVTDIYTYYSKEAWKKIHCCLAHGPLNFLGAFFWTLFHFQLFLLEQWFSTVGCDLTGGPVTRSQGSPKTIGRHRCLYA